MKKIVAIAVAFALVFSLFGCETGNASAGAAQVNRQTVSVDAGLAKIDSTAWQYNEEDGVYYQLGILYCANPADESYETLAVFVPDAYFNGTANGDGTYTCEINKNAEVGHYTAASAPIVMPINTPGYSAQSPLTSYSDFTDYTNEGFVYVHAGCRGRDAGAPAGVTDLKAAVRYIRYSADTVPGDTDSIFTFGMSGGGAQSAIMGSSGDSVLYDAYLEQIGAVEGYSDAVLGAMCWCPITNLDTADEAYEWMLGTTRSNLTEEEQNISNALAAAFATFINGAGFTAEDGTALTLTESDTGIYQAGTYYDYIKSVIEQSLNDFLANTVFPYDASSSSEAGLPGGTLPADIPDGNLPDGNLPGDLPGGNLPGGGNLPDGGNLPGGGNLPDMGGEAPAADEPAADAAGISPEGTDNIVRNETSGGVSVSGTFETAQDYINALNAGGQWIVYDAATNTATVSSVADFAVACKQASKNLGAFDQLDNGQGENTLFGYGDGNGAHFDSILANILKDLGADTAADYASDLEKTDSVGNTVDVRLNMYTPLYYLLESYDGYKTSTVAKYWRIRSGINQSDCALSTEVNLALALQNYSEVVSVDFAAVWGLGHTQAEVSGNSTDNFISWVNGCMGY